jgi:hypothetical protein
VLDQCQKKQTYTQEGQLFPKVERIKEKMVRLTAGSGRKQISYSQRRAILNELFKLGGAAFGMQKGLSLYIIGEDEEPLMVKGW